MDDPAYVQGQYADESRLAIRESVWRPTVDGRDPTQVALEAVVGALPAGRAMPDVLEVGCGTGALAERLHAAVPQSALIATDTSQRFVELTIQRGVQARLADVQQLPFDDTSYDVVVAAWMLYHVPDLPLGLSEIARVLRPGGTVVAITNGDEHVAELRRAAGGEAMRTAFSSENGEAALREHFGDVRRDDLRTRAVFGDHAAAVAYLESSQEDVDWRLPPFEGEREYAGHVTVFVATRA